MLLRVLTSASGCGPVYLKSRKQRNQGLVGEAEGFASAVIGIEAGFRHQEMRRRPYWKPASVDTQRWAELCGI